MPPHFLLLAEGLAVGALIHGGITFVGTHQNPVQGAVVLAVAVVSTGLDGAFNALVCMAIHSCILLLFGTALVWPKAKKQLRKNLPLLHFIQVCDIVSNR